MTKGVTLLEHPEQLSIHATLAGQVTGLANWLIGVRVLPNISTRPGSYCINDENPILGLCCCRFCKIVKPNWF